VDFVGDLDPRDRGGGDPTVPGANAFRLFLRVLREEPLARRCVSFPSGTLDSRSPVTRMRVPETPLFELSERSGGVLVCRMPGRPRFSGGGYGTLSRVAGLLVGTAAPRA
jgi:hypothetical protein